MSDDALTFVVFALGAANLLSLLLSWRATRRKNRLIREMQILIARRQP